MRLIWLNYFDPRKECGQVWWCRGEHIKLGRYSYYGCGAVGLNSDLK